MSPELSAIIIASIGGVVSIVSLLITLLVKQKVNSTHTLINSRMDEMLQLTKEKFEAIGNLKGREESRQETKTGTEPIKLELGDIKVELKPAITSPDTNKPE